MRILSFGFVVAAFAAAVMFGGCSNEFKLTDGWHEVPVVYGFIRGPIFPTQQSYPFTDTAQYIRIQKAFLDEKIGALELAKVTDSIYFGKLNVVLKEVKANGSIGKIYPLKLVDGNLEGVTKATGTFANSPNYLYKFSTPKTNYLNSGGTYRLEIQSEATGTTYTAQTPIIGNFTMNEIGSSVWEAGRPVYFSWYKPSNTSLYDVSVTFAYEEHRLSDSSLIAVRREEWLLQQSLTDDQNDKIRVSVDGGELYNFIKGRVKADPTVYRCNPQYYVNVYAVGNVFRNYLNSAQLATSVAGSDAVNQYTNVSNGGHGFLSTRYVHTELGKPFSLSTLTAIVDSTKGKGLNFVERCK